jgi:Holliday junction resolvase
VKKPPLEKTIVNSVMAVARSMGYWVMKNHGSQFSVAGLPDVLCIREGRVVWLEAKRPGEEPTRIQEHRMRELIGVGCPVAVVRSAGDAKTFLESLG